VIETIRLEEKFAQFDDHWNPRIIGALNGQHVKIARIKAEFVWHHHDNEDELFMVIAGELVIKVKDQADLLIRPGELAIIPRGVEHCPVAAEECQILLFEPAGTLNTGNVENERTHSTLESI